MGMKDFSLDRKCGLSKAQMDDMFAFPTSF
jgi:hypothetical protein